MSNIRLLTIRFANEILPREIPLLRGAVNAALEKEHSILFHNHTDKGFRYAYPLIQYKRIGGKAAMVCLEAGTEAIGEFFKLETAKLSLGDNVVDLQVEEVKAKETTVKIEDGFKTYRLSNWLPFNADNYREYMALEGLVEKILFIENILIANILAFMKGLNIFAEEELLCKILTMDEPRAVKYKGVSMLSYNITFKTNVSLPPLIGLGKGASTGHGVITDRHTQKNHHNYE